VPAALTRIARRADGWNPAGIPVDGMQQMFGGVQAMARAAGRDPSTLATARWLCRIVAFQRQNTTIGCWKINGLWASTFLFSVMCDRISGGHAPTKRCTC
jgi:hypothetical protein